MPRLDKECLSQYIRTECKRQLRLNLSPDSGGYKSERAAENMPPPQAPRPGLEQITQAGEQWQAAKIEDLVSTFGSHRMIASNQANPGGANPMDLSVMLPTARPDDFLIEAEYDVTFTFEAAVGITGHRHRFNLDYARVRPDIINVLAPGRSPQLVCPNGNVQSLPPIDERFQLRVIDVKLTSEPSPSYFAEVAYYSMVLAGWLLDNNFDDRFVVVPEGAVWPGSHDASILTVTANELRSQGVQPTVRQLYEAFEQDLENVPYEVFAFRVRRFLTQDVPFVLSRPWRTLDWHVDNRCKGCDNLGYPWLSRGQPTNHPDHCMPMAEAMDHVSRVAFVSRGAAQALRGRNVSNVATLSQLSPTDPAFDDHQVLRATRTVVSGRATALLLNQSQIPPLSGTSSIMPRWADLRVYLSVDFDLGSAITFAFGIEAFWFEHRAYGDSNPTPRQRKSWRPQSFVVDTKSLQAEKRELLAFLDQINTILNEASKQDRDTTVQFYIWDSLQYEHLCRVLGRHLQSILASKDLNHLAWLFPSEDVLPNSALVTRKSPITTVREVVQAVLAVPVPHYYTLLETARAYQSSRQTNAPPQLGVHPMFEDALSDQIPSERAHEIWTKSSQPYWVNQLQILQETVAKRLTGLRTIVQNLEADLAGQLGQTAPRINLIAAPKAQARISTDGQLWYAFSKLDSALAELEVHQVRAMPAHEREAHYESARLVQRIMGRQEVNVLQQFNLSPQVGRRVYQVSTGSKEVRVKEGDFLFALSPEADSGFLDKTLQGLAANKPLSPLLTSLASTWSRMERVTNVSIRAVDRSSGVIVVDADQRHPTILDELESYNLVDLSRNAILDPTYDEYFVSKLLVTLKAIGNPSSAQANAQVRRALGQTTGRGARQSAHTPVADFLWSGAAMHQTPVPRSLPPVRTRLQQFGVYLNLQQWNAWKRALSRRLSLIWGPPGTGKSRTVHAIVLGALVEAESTGKPLRVLICTSTHTAMDNVLLDVHDDLKQLIPAGRLETFRLRSKWHLPEPHVPRAIDTEVNRHSPSSRVLDLKTRLDQSDALTLVAGLPQQVHNLMMTDGGSAWSEPGNLVRCQR